ncbi:hypothetical protein HOG75_00905, partial [bacterium]|nr:hypothetical protein [bacterium]
WVRLYFIFFPTFIFFANFKRAIAGLGSKSVHPIAFSPFAKATFKAALSLSGLSGKSSGNEGAFLCLLAAGSKAESFAVAAARFIRDLVVRPSYIAIILFRILCPLFNLKINYHNYIFSKSFADILPYYLCLKNLEEVLSPKTNNLYLLVDKPNMGKNLPV